MTNDSKLGMLAGVLGVVVAALLINKGDPPRPAEPQPTTKSTVLATPSKPLAARPESPNTANNSATATGGEVTSTPVVRTRKDVDAQPTSRQPGADEEP